MSKPFSSFLLLAVIAFSAIFATGQVIEATIEIDFNTPGTLTVRGHYVDGGKTVNRRNLAFVRNVPGSNDIAERISEMRLLDKAGKPMTFRKLMAGEYLSDSDFDGWEYKVDLAPLKNRDAAAHASWFVQGKAILMLADLLPQFATNTSKASGRITFKMPGTGHNGPLI